MTKAERLSLYDKKEEGRSEINRTRVRCFAVPLWKYKLVQTNLKKKMSEL